MDTSANKIASPAWPTYPTPPKKIPIIVVEKYNALLSIKNLSIDFISESGTTNAIKISHFM